jgi:hypothetical protein
MLTELLIYHCDLKDQVVPDHVLLSNDQLSELLPGSLFYYRKDGTEKDIDQPCSNDQLFMVVVNGYSTTIEHFEDYQKVHNHISVLEVATGEIYHEKKNEWVHFIELVNLQVFVK